LTVQRDAERSRADETIWHERGIIYSPTVIANLD
jgi:hypothetical protein